MFHLNGKEEGSKRSAQSLGYSKLISSALQERRQKLTQPEVAEHKNLQVIGG